MPPAVFYQDAVTTLTKIARPLGFQPTGQLLICYQMFLARNIDADNVLKLTNDAIAKAIGINDSRFLPVVLHKSSGNTQPRLVISIFDANAYRLEVMPCS